MDRMARTIAKRLVLLFACLVVAVIILAQGFSHGVFSSRAFGGALLILGIAMSVATIITLAKAARDHNVEPPQQCTPSMDDASRKRHLLCIRAAKAMIVVLFLSLILGLLRGGPWLPVLVGTIMAIGLIASLMWWIMQLQKSLN